MLRRRITLILAAAVMTLPLAACDFTATGNVECHTDEAGKYVCVANSTATPKTPAPPATTTPAPPTTEPTTPPPTTTTTPPPATTTPPPSSSTPPPVNPDGVTAASKLGWGTPIAAETDEFNYVGAPGSMWWNAEGCWSGHNGNGQRCEKNTTVDGNKLVMTGDANGDTGIIGQKDGRQYGRWEARIRSQALDPASSRQYHPLLIIWPDSDRWPQDGEYDFFENDRPGQQSAQAFIHYPHNSGVPVQQERAFKDGVDTSQWRNVAIEWTPNHVKGFIDGVEWFSYSGGSNSVRKNIQAMPSGHLTIQLDNFYGSNMGRAKYEIDWVRSYTL